jgi:hypothetical protein
LIGLAAVTVGLISEAAQHLEVCCCNVSSCIICSLFILKLIQYHSVFGENCVELCVLFYPTTTLPDFISFQIIHRWQTGNCEAGLPVAVGIWLRFIELYHWITHYYTVELWTLVNDTRCWSLNNR